MAQLIQNSDIDLSSKLRCRLVQKLYNLLRHGEGSLSAVDRVRGKEQNLTDKMSDIVIGGECRQRLVRKLDHSSVKFFGYSLQQDMSWVLRTLKECLTAKRSIASGPLMYAAPPEASCTGDGA